MSKFWKIGNRDDTLPYFVQAPNREMAIKVVEDLMGPQNPSRRITQELVACPVGFKAIGDEPQILTETEEE
jgi:hypothetical protein